MENFYAVQFTKARGKITKTLSSGSSALLKLWCLQNTGKSRISITFNYSGEILFSCAGDKDGGFPDIDIIEETNISELCLGLLEELTGISNDI